jgi:hypothetical protein
VECKSPLITAKLRETDLDEEGNQRTRVTVAAAGRVPPGIRWADLVIHTDDPRYPTLQVPLQIRGPAEAPAR